MLFGSSHLVTGEDERGPDEEAGHSLSRWGHEEDGLVLAQQRGLREPRHVGARRGGRRRGRGGRRQDGVLPQPL